MMIRKLLLISFVFVALVISSKAFAQTPLPANRSLTAHGPPVCTLT